MGDQSVVLAVASYASRAAAEQGLRFPLVIGIVESERLSRPAPWWKREPAVSWRLTVIAAAPTTAPGE